MFTRIISLNCLVKGNQRLMYPDVLKRFLESMKKKIFKDTGHELFEKRCHHWALNKSGFDSYEDLQQETPNAALVEESKEEWFN